MIRFYKLILGVLLLPASLAGCESGPAHLDATHIQSLNGRSIAVVYVDSATPLNPILSVQPAGEIPAYLDYKAFRSQLEPYQAIAGELKDQDIVYAEVRKVLGGVAWLRDASWTRVHKQDPSDYAVTFAEETDADVVVLLDTAVDVHSYMDKISVVVDATIYIKVKPKSRGVVSYISSPLRGDVALGTQGGEQSFGFDLSTQPLPDSEVKSRLEKVFAGHGAVFMEALAIALRSLDQPLVYFFTGTGSVPVSP